MDKLKYVIDHRTEDVVNIVVNKYTIPGQDGWNDVLIKYIDKEITKEQLLYQIQCYIEAAAEGIVEEYDADGYWDDDQDAAVDAARVGE